MAGVSSLEKKNNTALIIAILLFLLLIFGFGGGFGMSGMLFFGPVFMILFFVLIVWLIATLIQSGEKK